MIKPPELESRPKVKEIEIKVDPQIMLPQLYDRLAQEGVWSNTRAAIMQALKNSSEEVIDPDLQFEIHKRTNNGGIFFEIIITSEHTPLKVSVFPNTDKGERQSQRRVYLYLETLALDRLPKIFDQLHEAGFTYKQCMHAIALIALRKTGIDAELGIRLEDKTDSDGGTVYIELLDPTQE